jgi:hypothetical protein
VASKQLGAAEAIVANRLDCAGPNLRGGDLMDKHGDALKGSVLVMAEFRCEVLCEAIQPSTSGQL